MVELGFLPTGTLGLPVLLTNLRAGPAPPLPSGRLPASHPPQAFGVLAIALVPAPRPVPTAAALPQTDSRPRPTALGCTWLGSTGRLLEAHGRCYSLGSSPRRKSCSSSGTSSGHGDAPVGMLPANGPPAAALAPLPTSEEVTHRPGDAPGEAGHGQHGERNGQAGPVAEVRPREVGKRKKTSKLRSWGK